MKQIIIAMCISVFAMADEFDRMESIVLDIKNLRADYTECKKELKSKSTNKILVKTNVENRLEIELFETNKMMQEYKTLLNEERLKNTKNNEKSNINLINLVKTKEDNKKIKNKKNIENLKAKYEKIIKNRDNKIIYLKNKIKSIDKTIIIEKKICEDDNPFPQLMMKNSLKKSTNREVTKPKQTINIKKENEASLEKKVDTKARTYRLSKESNIYDDVNGNILYTWENKTSFTSTKMTQNWIEVTGYFIDRKWLKAKKSLWLEKVNATVR